MIVRAVDAIGRAKSKPQVALFAQTLVLYSPTAVVGLAVDHEFDKCVEIVILTVDLAVYTLQISDSSIEIGVYRRDHAAVTRACKLDKMRSPSSLFFDHAAPADAIVIQLTVPFVVCERDVIGFE